MTLLDSTVDGLDAAACDIQTHDRVRKARSKARHKRATRIERDRDSVLEGIRKRAERRQHRDRRQALTLEDIGQPDPDSPEFWFCDPRTKEEVDVSATC